MATAAGRRLAATNRLRKNRQRASPIGAAIIDRALELGIGLKGIAATLKIGLNAAHNLIYKEGRWARPRAVGHLTRFLNRSVEDVETLLREGGGRPRFHETGVTCDYCGKPIRRCQSQVDRTLLHFCNPEHRWKYDRTHRRPPLKDAVGQAWRQRRRPRPGGRQQLQMLRIRRMASPKVVAEASGLHIATIYSALRDPGRCRPLTRYVMEESGLFPARWRPRLTNAIFAFCLEDGIKPYHLARRAGIAYAPTLMGILRRGAGLHVTLAKLAVAMGRQPEDLERLCDPDRYRAPERAAWRLYGSAISAHQEPDPKAIAADVLTQFPDADADDIRQEVERLMGKRRGPGAPPRYTPEEALEIHRIVHAERQPVVAAGRRMGWPETRSGHCKRAENAFRSAVPVCPICSPPN